MDRPHLARLVPDPELFGSRYWSSEPLLTRARDLPKPFDDLLDQAGVDTLVSERGLRTPFLRVAKAGSTLGDREFTAGGGIGAGVGDQVSDDRLVRLFADGATMVLQGLHRSWAPLVHFSQGLAADLGHPVQVNAYVTPPQNQGFADHYDVHDVFVLQTHGRKEWRLHAPVHDAPLRDDVWTDRKAAVEAEAAREPYLRAVLEPGDCLYLPRGWLHAATAQGEVSTHVTIGVHTWTRHHLARELLDLALDRAQDDVAVRTSLALGTDVTSPDALAGDVDAARAALLQALSQVDVAEVAERLRSSAVRAQRAAPVGPLAQHRAAAELTEGATLRLREHLLARLVDDGDGVRLVSRTGDVVIRPQHVDAVRRLLDEGTLVVADVELGRRLLLCGVVVVA